MHYGSLTRKEKDVGHERERLHKEIMIESLLYFKRNTDLLVHEAQSFSHKRVSPRPTAIVKPKVKNISILKTAKRASEHEPCSTAIDGH